MGDYWVQHIGDDQLIYGLPKHMVGVANTAANAYWEIVPSKNACRTCKAMGGCGLTASLSRFIRTAPARRAGLARLSGSGRSKPWPWAHFKDTAIMKLKALRLGKQLLLRFKIWVLSWQAFGYESAGERSAQPATCGRGRS